MKIFKILFISFVLFSGLGAQAGKVSSLNYRPLIAKLQQKIQARKKMFTESNLLKFTISPAAPKATEDVTLFIQPVTGFTDSEILLQTTFDGTDNTANLEHPATELWVVDLGSFTELRPYTLDAKIFIRDKNSAQLIIDAMAALDASIADLNNQIAAATDPAVIADLTAQRDDKIAQKNQLATTLAGLQSQVGEETFTFNVNEDTTLSDYPKIQSVTPNVVKTNTALAFTIAGSNLANTTQVKVDGTAVTTSLITSTSISAIATPTTDGPHSLEVRTVSGTQIKNVILQNAIFSTSKDLYVPNTPPTAVAAAVSSPINLGSSAQVTAAGSFDANNFSLGYAWRFKTVPSGATEVAGSTILGTSSTYSFNPSVPGLYVLQLIVTETQGSLLPSSAAYAIVEVTAPANRAALIGSKPINTLINQSASVTIYGLDLDLWQAHSYFITKQGTLGTATISNNVVTYTAGSTSGSDTITVAVVDNGTPPMANSINIPVTVYALNTAPSFSSVSAQAVTEGLPVTVRFTVNGLADSNGLGTISEIKIQPGDGTTEYAPTNGGNLGILGHNYVAYGTYTATVTVTDNLGASYSQNLTVTVQANDLPTAKFSMNKYSCTAPCTLTVDASASTDSNGISEYRWLWGDGSAEQSTTSTTVTHTFNSNGNYRFRLRTIDSLGAVGESMANIYVGVTAPSSGSPSYPDFINTTIREVTAGTPVSFNAARSFDPNPSGNITNYSWNASGCSGSCTATGSTSSFAYST
ncbi:MAG: PKD domain-containing protein, partial [Pseudobdellovibrio sp.]